MAYGSTPYAGMTPKKRNGGHIRLVNGLHEQYQALSSVSMLGRIKDWVQLFCARCLNYPWGGRYRTINRKAVVSM